MMDKMSAKMSPEDMRTMMQQMMHQMTGDLSMEDRITFMQSMMGSCIPMMTQGLDVDARTRLAQSLFQGLSGSVDHDGV
jgi:hypothetical protein